MTTRTRKAPSGAKHARCTSHVEHPYPKSGWLCVGIDGRESVDMVPFADHLAEVVAYRTARGFSRPLTFSQVRPIPVYSRIAEGPTLAECNWSASVLSCQRDIPAASPVVAIELPAVASVTRSATGGWTAAHVSQPADAAALAELVARFRTMRGLPVAPVQVQPIAEPVRKPARKPSPAVRANRRREVAAVMATIQPEPIACPYTTDGKTACIAGDLGHVGPHDYPNAGERCMFYWYTLGGPRRCIVRPDHHDGPHEYPAAIQTGAPELDTYAAAVELAETRPDPCEACGHPSHGGTCAACEDAAQVGTYAPCAAVATVQPIAEPAPVLSAPSASQRPTCERCGQVFRKSGSGAEWHRVNRLDCARVAVAV